MGTPATHEAGYDRALTRFLTAFADHDEQWAGGLHREVADRLVTLAAAQPGDSCLEVGGGAGEVADALSAAVGPQGSVVSLNVQERPARSRTASNLHVMRMSAEDVIFRDRTFDVVVLSRSIAYAADAVVVLREAIRTLKPGGRLVLFCRRRDLATRAEESFLSLLGDFVQEQPFTVPGRFLTYPGLAGRRDIEAVLRDAGMERVVFGDVVTGGRASDAAAFGREMMRCWPGARIVLDALAGRKRRMFEARVDGLMRGLGEDAFRYHHPYLLASGIRAAPAS